MPWSWPGPRSCGSPPRPSAEVRAALAEALSDHDARSALRSAMAFLSVCSIDGPDVRFALEHEGLPYRAALTESCARKLQADFIVTHGGEVSVSRASAPRGPRRAVQRA